MTKLFGILNITPDSFSDGGKYMDLQIAIEQAQKLFNQGADYIDIGGQSTRPGAKMISWQQEWGRLESILSVLVQHYLGQISLDTFRPEIAQKFIDLGGTILNDVTGFQDPEMVEVAVQMCERCKGQGTKDKEYKSPLNSSESQEILRQAQDDSHLPFIIVNHFPGKTVEEVHEQKICSINQVVEDLLIRKRGLEKEGIPAESIILDPGIGFGKTIGLNEKLLEFAKEVPDERVLIGHSRKRFLGAKRFDHEVNLKAGTKAIEAGAEFLRVHEVEGYKKKLKSKKLIAIFGGQGSQTDYAVDHFQGLKATQRVYYDSMQEVCEAVISEKAQYGLLPIHNTVGGEVQEALKALEHKNIQIQEKKVVPIAFHLAGKEPITLSQVKKVLSHWQSLAQSKEWLRKHIAHVKKEKVISSARAAELVSGGQSRFTACICHHQTAVDNGLVFLANHIEEEGNKTTFVLIAKKQ